jgi:hypothetical protein
MKRMFHYYAKYPSETERNYMMDIIFTSFVRLRDLTLGWIIESLKEIGEDIMTNPDKEEVVSSLQKMQVVEHDFRNKTEEQQRNEDIMSEHYLHAFENFKYR